MSSSEATCVLTAQRTLRRPEPCCARAEPPHKPMHQVQTIRLLVVGEPGAASSFISEYNADGGHRTHAARRVTLARRARGFRRLRGGLSAGARRAPAGLLVGRPVPAGSRQLCARRPRAGITESGDRAARSSRIGPSGVCVTRRGALAGVHAQARRGRHGRGRIAGGPLAVLRRRRIGEQAQLPRAGLLRELAGGGMRRAVPLPQVPQPCTWARTYSRRSSRAATRPTAACSRSATTRGSHVWAGS